MLLTETDNNNRQQVIEDEVNYQQLPDTTLTDTIPEDNGPQLSQEPIPDTITDDNGPQLPQETIPDGIPTDNDPQLHKEPPQNAHIDDDIPEDLTCQTQEYPILFLI